MWKLLTGIVADEIYNSLEEQKGCCRNSRGTKDQLLIDKTVLTNCKRRKVGLSMVWIDYRYHTRGLKNPWRCVELQIPYLIFCPGVWKTGKQSSFQGVRQSKYSERNLSRRYSSPFLFVIGLIPLSHTLRKVYAGYQLGKGQHKRINNILFMDEILFI